MSKTELRRHLAFQRAKSSSKELVLKYDPEFKALTKEWSQPCGMSPVMLDKTGRFRIEGCEKDINHKYPMWLRDYLNWAEVGFGNVSESEFQKAVRLWEHSNGTLRNLPKNPKTGRYLLPDKLQYPQYTTQPVLNEFIKIIEKSGYKVKQKEIPYNKIF